MHRISAARCGTVVQGDSAGHAGAFDHYFFTANADEIAALDRGMFPGGERTGESFNVYSAPFFGTASVCRFFSASFAPKSTHFYTQDAGECSFLSAGGVWQFEGDVMAMPGGGRGRELRRRNPAGLPPVQ